MTYNLFGGLILFYVRYGVNMDNRMIVTARWTYFNGNFQIKKGNNLKWIIILHNWDKIDEYNHYLNALRGFCCIL
jgi:hypothetical protein